MSNLLQVYLALLAPSLYVMSSNSWTQELTPFYRNFGWNPYVTLGFQQFTPMQRHPQSLSTRWMRILQRYGWNIYFWPDVFYPYKNIGLDNFIPGDDISPPAEEDGHRFPLQIESVWPKGIIPYAITESLETKKEIIRAAMDYIENHTCIHFVPRSKEKNYIKMYKGKGCFSKVGMTGGAQDLSLGKGCYKMGKILHELLHVLGFYHEQSRFDRDNYITVNWDNIKPGHEKDFKKLKPQRILLSAPYDYDSIMHYSDLAFSKNRTEHLKTMTPKIQGVTLREVAEKLPSSEDIRRINELYGCVSQLSDSEIDDVVLNDISLNNEIS